MEDLGSASFWDAACWSLPIDGSGVEGSPWFSGDYGGPCWSAAGGDVGDWRAGNWCNGWWAPPQLDKTADAPVATMAWQPKVALRPMDEHLARIHYNKTYQVLSEVIDAYPVLFGGAETFLDLGCAPGGFACRLLEQKPGAQGYGVTLPTDAGGFPILFADERLTVQKCNLMDLSSPNELDCPDEVDVCLADAQDLGRRTKPIQQQRGNRGQRRNGRSGRNGFVSTPGGIGASQVGIQATCTVLGIWALTLQEMLLGLGRLRAGGTFFFRFGWRGRGVNEEEWYRQATIRLFAFVFAHFLEVVPFKSEFSHQADSSFYVVASGFRRDVYGAASLERKLREAIDYVITCERVVDLPWCVEAMEEYVTPDLQNQIEGLLDSVGRLRAIGLASRHHVEAGGQASAEAGLWISPVPFSLTMPMIRERLERYGKIAYVRRRAHPIGVGADAHIQFTQPAHAAAALEAITNLKVLGGNIIARRLCDVETK